MEQETRGISHSTRGKKEEEKTPSGSSWFLGIGIDEYLEFSSLNNAVRDVQSIAGLLQENYDLSQDKTIFLFNREATREKIIISLDWLVKRVQFNDKVLIYYSGHGYLEKQTQKGFWIPYDAQQDNKAQYIRNSTIRDYMDDLPARHNLLISDSCFSGSLLVRGTTRSSDMFNELDSRPSRWVLCSGREQEEVADGVPGANSPFASAILEVLGRNDQAVINISKLADQVMEITRSNYHQLPEGGPLFGTGHKGGQYVFRKKDTAFSPDTAENKQDKAEVLHHRAGRSAVPFKKMGKYFIMRWGLGALLYIISLLILLFLIGASPISYVIEPLIPVLFYPLPFIVTYFVHLPKNTLWLLTAGYAIVFFVLTYRWIATDEQLSNWMILPCMILGSAFYYFLLPKLNERK